MARNPTPSVSAAAGAAAAAAAAANAQPKPHPPGALVRVQDICRHPKTGRPGLLPIDRSTWHRWIKAGKVPPGRELAGSALKVWPIELVRSLAGHATADTHEAAQT